jgi:hypothetical protein
MFLRFVILASTARLSLPSMLRSSSSDKAPKFRPAGIIGGGGGKNIGGSNMNGGGGGMVDVEGPEAGVPAAASVVLALGAPVVPAALGVAGVGGGCPA